MRNLAQTKLYGIKYEITWKEYMTKVCWRVVGSLLSGRKHEPFGMVN